MIVNEVHQLVINLDHDETFKSTVVIGNRKKRKAEIIVHRVVVYANDFDTKQPARFGKVFVRGWYVRQDGEMGSIQYPGTLPMSQLPVEVRAVVLSFFYPLIPRSVLSRALGVPVSIGGRTGKEPRGGATPARTRDAGTVGPVPYQTKGGITTV